MSNADDRNKDFWEKVDEMEPVASDDAESAVEDSPDVAVPEPLDLVDPDPDRPLVDPGRPFG
jgi:hypothetical protein